MTNEQRITNLERIVENQDKIIRQMKLDLDEMVKFSTATTRTFQDVVFFTAGSKVGFWGKEPVKQQSVASDTLANLYTALRTLGIIA